MRKKTMLALILAVGALTVVAGLAANADRQTVAAEATGLAVAAGPIAAGPASSVALPDPTPMAVAYPTSCTATNDCQCCPIHCSGTHSCIAFSNYVSCDGATKYCGTPCC
jgi:hypothetical protein